MRNYINDFLNNSDKNFWFLHCDSWHYQTTYKCINCGVQEPNMLNIASGLMLNNQKVIVYSIAGFVLEKCIEQLRLVVPNSGSLILLIAGAHHEYPKELGVGHQIDPEYILKYLEQYNYHIYDLSKTEPKSTWDKVFKLNGKSIVLLGKE